jgi:AmiR/NasT family two-component response regulator
MAKEGIAEREAFERLRRASQISGRPLKVVADALIATFEQPDRGDTKDPRRKSNV